MLGISRATWSEMFGIATIAVPCAIAATIVALAIVSYAISRLEEHYKKYSSKAVKREITRLMLNLHGLDIASVIERECKPQQLNEAQRAVYQLAKNNGYRIKRLSRKRAQKLGIDSHWMKQSESA